MNAFLGNYKSFNEKRRIEILNDEKEKSFQTLTSIINIYIIHIFYKATHCR